MPKFKFGLQKVMQHRKAVEDLAQRDFQEAQAELHRQNEILIGMYQAIEEARKVAFTKQTMGGTAISALSQVHDFVKGQDVRIERQKAKIQECESLVENLREILRKAAMDYKIIEGLRDKRKDEFKKKVSVKEQKLTDDLNLMRFRRGEKSGDIEK